MIRPLTSLGLVIFEKSADNDLFHFTQIVNVMESTQVINMRILLNTIVLFVCEKDCSQSTSTGTLLFVAKNQANNWSIQQRLPAPSPSCEHDLVGDSLFIKGNTLYLVTSSLKLWRYVLDGKWSLAPLGDPNKFIQTTSLRKLNNMTDAYSQKADSQQSFSYFQASSPWLLVLVTLGTLFFLVLGVVMTIHPYSRQASSIPSRHPEHHNSIPSVSTIVTL